ncbi:variant erythrocyte surface antigen alpha subunit, putative [Babesia ovis]|uniref:Variant erythrocyte surface antigen alpha subunit, putative n=1 Tax=Babesia ovis TaxID=5869 RepID=A0A9W5TDP0_BABOV|nr:variant erythrocyte surface antigen alpha subunit, putative [Babesia ovis]
MSYGTQRRKSQLTECPTSFKEAVDWILRITEKDGQNYGISTSRSKGDQHIFHVDVGDSKGLGEAIWTVAATLPNDGQPPFQDVWSELDNNTASATTVGEHVIDHIDVLINGLSDRLAKFVGYYISLADDRWFLGHGGIGKKDTYNSSYEYSVDTTWEEVKRDDGKTKICAQILLGCIPLIFSGLSYLYWQCSEGKGSGGNPDKRWHDTEQAINQENSSICIYMESMGYKRAELCEKQTWDVKELLEAQFEEFSKIAEITKDKYIVRDPSAIQRSYAEFINTIQTTYKSVYERTDTTGLYQLKEEAKKAAQERPLYRLYAAAEWYFQTLQGSINKECHKGNTPTNIRDMLYWLMGLPYSPVYMGLKNGIVGDELIVNGSDKGKVGDLEDTSADCTITSISDSLDYYLLPPCYYAGFVVMAFQGSLEDAPQRPLEKPFLHELYSNHHFQFYYPENVNEWFGMLWDVVYSVYFRMNFLKIHCGVDPKSFLILSMAIVY